MKKSLCIVVSIILFEAFSFGQKNTTNITEGKYLIEDLSQIVDRKGHEYIQRIIHSTKLKRKIECKVNEEKFIRIGKYCFEGNCRFLLLKQTKLKSEYFIVDPKLGYESSNFLLVAKFSEYITSTDPDFGCIIDSYGNYCFFNTFLGGYTSDVVNLATKNKISKLTNRIDSVNYSIEKFDVNIINELPKQSFKFKTNVTFNEVTKGGFIPLTFFINNSKLKEQFSQINIDISSCFFVSLKSVSEDSNEIYAFEKIKNELDGTISYIFLSINMNNDFYSIHKYGVITHSVNGIEYSNISMDDLDNLFQFQ